jgi:hypothetical protein
MHGTTAPIRGLLSALVVLIVSGPVLATDLDAWQTILTRHTREVADIAGVRVDYAALKESAEWRALVASLARSDPQELRGRDETLAFWINAYNILAIDVVVQNHPVASIKDVGSLFRPVWKKPAGAVGGEIVTLDQIEHDILRPMGEPRIHAAIVCASLSCPPLRREPYRAETLSAQLDDNVRVWLADPRKGAGFEGDELQLSSILEWFAKDFEAAGGVVAFVAKHGPAAVQTELERRPDPPIDYLPYDWSLNDIAIRDGS